MTPEELADSWAAWCIKGMEGFMSRLRHHVQHRGPLKDAERSLVERMIREMQETLALDREKQHGR